MKSERIGIIILFWAVLVAACTERKDDRVMAPWGEVTDSMVADATFDLSQIQAGGELIALTLTGPETFYDYHGRHLGTHYMLCQRFADSLGVGLRVDVCRDSAEMVERLDRGDADLIAYPLDSLGPGWRVGEGKEELRRELSAWYRPERMDEVRRQEAFLLSSKSVKRHVYAPMLNRSAGVISRYDALFQQYARPIRWDWRLMAAQCYQESTFDPKATSWAGACGLMQIMPATADHLGLKREQMYEPEPNIAAASRYLAELEGKFTDIADRQERTRFVLASYNGGFHHIRDAMALCQRDGHNPHRWADVSPYVLKLATPQYYNDPVVKHGYMRGSETVDYVAKIMERHQSYRHVKTTRIGPSGMQPQRAKKRGKYKI